MRDQGWPNQRMSDDAPLETRAGCEAFGVRVRHVSCWTQVICKVEVIWHSAFDVL